MGKKAQDQIPQTELNKSQKHSILVDGKGVPLGVCVDGANRHDMKMTKATLQSIVIYRPEPTIRSKRARVHGQRLRVSRGIRITGRVWLYNSHQIKRKEKAALKKEYQNTELRRWVVERTHSWMNRFRRLLVRWEKRIENYIGMLHFACAWITYRRSGLFA